MSFNFKGNIWIPRMLRRLAASQSGTMAITGALVALPLAMATASASNLPANSKDALMAGLPALPFQKSAGSKVALKQ